MPRQKVWACESCGGDKQAIPNPNFDFFEMFLFSLSLTRTLLCHLGKHKPNAKKYNIKAGLLQ